MTSTQVVETSVNVITNSPSQDYTHQDDYTLPTYDTTPGFKPFTRGGGGDRSEAWDGETMFSQLAKRSSENVDSGVRNSKYFRSTRIDMAINVIWNSFQNLCIFCRGKVSGERLISHGTDCQFRTREYSMEATSMKTFLFSHCLVCCSGEWISCELYGSHVSLVYAWRTGLLQTFQSWILVLDNST